MRNPSRQNRGWRRRQVVGGLLLACVTLLGAGLRLNALREPAWLDELHTGWVVAAGPAEMAERAAGGNQASAYFWLPWLSTKMLGGSTFALRLPSLAAGIALIPACYWLVFRATRSREAGLVAAVLVAVDRDCVFYGVEARTYAIVQLTGVLHVLAGLIAWRRDRRAARVGWLASAIVLFYLHYTTALLIGAEFVLVAALGLVRRWARARAGLTNSAGAACGRITPGRWAVGLGVYLAAGAPVLAHLATVAERRRNWGDTLAADALATLFPWTACVVAPLVALSLSVVTRLIAGTPPLARWRRVAAPCAFGTLVALSTLAAVAATASGEAQLQRYRYLILAATLLPCATAATTALAASRGGRVLFAAIVIGWAGLDSEPAVRWRYPGTSGDARHEDWSGALARLDSDAATQAWPVLLCGGMVEDRQLTEEGVPAGWSSRRTLEDFCRFPVRSLFPLARPDKMILPLPTTVAPRTTSAVRRQVVAAGGAWLVVRGSPGAAARIADDVAGEFAADVGGGAVRQSSESYGGVTLVRLEFSRGGED